MRTHLLRTFYPSPDIEFDTGRASNDDCYVIEIGVSPVTTQTANALDGKTNPLLEAYELGGYAGI